MQLVQVVEIASAAGRSDKPDGGVARQSDHSSPRLHRQMVSSRCARTRPARAFGHPETREAGIDCSDPAIAAAVQRDPATSGRQSRRTPRCPCVVSAPPCHWPTVTTAPQSDIAEQAFEVIHPFHPWRGQQFKLVVYKSAWGEDRVYFHNESQQLIALPASWTDVVAADPFISVAEGRAVFRADDLFELATLVRCLSAKGSSNV